MTRILVYCPMHPGYGIRPRTLESIFALRWPGELVLSFARKPEDGRGHENILEKYREGRRMALGGGFDALLTVEADMIVPPLALERLAALEAEVAYGLYCSRHYRHSWLVFTHVEKTEAAILPKDLRAAYWGAAVDSAGIGFGCTLIRREVLEEIDFRLEAGGPAPDWWFALDCYTQGIRQVSDLGVVCGHYLDEHQVLWPDPAQPELYRTEVI